MFGLVIFKHKDNQKNSLQKPSQINSEEKQEKIIVDIDYDELADAIVRANNKIEQAKVNDTIEKEIKNKQRREEIFGKNRTALATMFKLWFLKDEQASSLSGTKLLFPMLNAILLYMVQILFLLSSFVFAGSTLILLIGWISFVCQNSCDFALLLQSLVRYGVPITFYVLCFVACMTLGSLFKLARIDVEQTKDYNMQFNLFGALSSFVAVVVAIISLFMQR